MSEIKNPPYNPSWINRITNWIEELPGRSLTYYLGFGVILLVIQTSVLWIEGAALIGIFLPPHLFFSAAIPFILGIIPYFDERAIKAFESLRPYLKVDEAEHQTLIFQLTTLPRIKTIIWQVAVIGAALLIESFGQGAYQLEVLLNYPISATILRFTYFLCWFVFGGFIYHTIHQLSLINRIYMNLSQINLYHLKPLYGFSNLTAMTAGSLVLLPYGFYLITPTISINDPAVLSFYLFITLIAVVTFILPQLGIHQIQDAEKSRYNAEAYKRYEAIIAEIHQRVDEKDFDGVSNLSVGFTLIEQEINSIKKTSTWPWQPETIRWLVTALVLPLGLWLIQYFLQQLLSK